MTTRELEKVFKALANRRRLAILKFLKESGEASVGEIAGEIKLSFKSTSRHIQILTGLNILDRDQRGLGAYYRISKEQNSVVRHALSML